MKKYRTTSKKKLNENGNNATEIFTFDDLPEKNLSVCVTKQNYVPLVLTTDEIKSCGLSPENIYIQNETLSNSSSYKAKNIYIGTNVTDSKEHGDVHLENGEYVFDAEKYVIKSNVYISKNATIKVKRNFTTE